MFAKLLSIFTISIFLWTTANAAELFFAKKTIYIITKNGKKHQFTAEIADTLQKQEQGLMFRKNMAKDHGMLFLLDNKKFANGNGANINMWMKDTYIPLDIIFIKSNGTIKKIAKGTPLSLESIQSGGEVAAIVEINSGVCKKLGININDKVVF